jgi:hypothetical protein
MERRYSDLIAVRIQVYVQTIQQILTGLLGEMTYANGVTSFAIRNADDWIDRAQPKITGLEVVLEPVNKLAFREFASAGLIEDIQTRLTLKQWDVKRTTIAESELLLRHFDLVNRNSYRRIPRSTRAGVLDQSSMMIVDLIEVR